MRIYWELLARGPENLRGEIFGVIGKNPVGETPLKRFSGKEFFAKIRELWKMPSEKGAAPFYSPKKRGG